jgi:hypothetical protein
MSRASRLSFSFFLLFIGAVSLWAQRFLVDGPFPYSLAVFALSVATVVLAWSLATGGPVGTALRIIRIAVSAIVGLLSLLPVGDLFDRMDWPIFHSWGLGHGSFVFITAWVGFLVYWALGIIAWLRERAP